jgi:hypothetical protein
MLEPPPRGGKFGGAVLFSRIGNQRTSPIALNDLTRVWTPGSPANVVLRGDYHGRVQGLHFDKNPTGSGGLGAGTLTASTFEVAVKREIMVTRQ